MHKYEYMIGANLVKISSVGWTLGVGKETQCTCRHFIKTLLGSETQKMNHWKLKIKVCTITRLSLYYSVAKKLKWSVTLIVEPRAQEGVIVFGCGCLFKSTLLKLRESQGYDPGIQGKLCLDSGHLNFYIFVIFSQWWIWGEFYEWNVTKQMKLKIKRSLCLKMRSKFISWLW